MVEIFILYKLCKRIGKAAREKGLRAIKYQLLVILFWFVGEFVGGLIAGVILIGSGENDYVLLIYPVGIAGAIFGSSLVFTMIRNVPDPNVGQLTDQMFPFES